MKQKIVFFTFDVTNDFHIDATLPKLPIGTPCLSALV